MFSFGSTYRRLIKQRDQQPFRSKVVLVGDHGCGKTCLLTSICVGPYERQSYIPTLFLNHIEDLTVDDVVMEMIPLDVPGDKDLYDSTVPLLFYPDIDVIVFCFSFDSESSLQNVEKRWLAEKERYCPGVPSILIGNKKDLRDELKNELGTGETDFVTHDQGKEMAEKIGAVEYLECSAKTMDGISIILPTAGRVALQAFRARRRGHKCGIL